MTNEWQSIEGDSFEPLLEKVNALHYRKYFEEDSARLFSREVPFYSTYKVLRATEYSTHPPLSMRFLFNGLDVIKLDRTKEPLLEAASKAPLTLNDDNVVEYAKFFMDAIDAEDGSFLIAEDIEDVTFVETPEEELEKAVEEKLFAMKVTESSDAGYKIKASLIYAGCLYHATLEVFKDGNVDIAEEEIVMSDLPVRKIMLK